MQPIAEQKVNTYLDALASNAPTPGGGGAAAVTASQGAALLGMVLRFTVGRKKYMAHDTTLQPLLTRSDTLRCRALELADRDAEAFAAVGACYSMPRKTATDKEARRQAMDRALLAAARVPLHVMQDIRILLQDAIQVGTLGNRNVLTDVMVAAHLFQAAAMSCEVNVRINMKLATPSPHQQALLTQLHELQTEIASQVVQVLDACNQRLKLTS